MPRSVALGLYLAFARIAEPWVRRKLNRRLAAGKEHPQRLPERLGHAGLPRPDGPLIWLHAASVGESMAVLEMMRRLMAQRPDLHGLITTGTLTSAEMLADRLPERVVHQFIPVDTCQAVERFLNHWKPDLAVWTESEFWPTLICRTAKRGIPMVLINARMSPTSFRNWKRAKGVARSLLSRFSRVLAQDKDTAGYLAELGMAADLLETTGSLKEGSAPLSHNAMERKSIARLVELRPVWLAASTHPDEEAIAATAHRQARRSFPNLLMLLAPRHPERGNAIASELRAQRWQVAQRSKGEPITAATDIYLADTMGEMGLWYRLATVSFIGGSFVPVGGHNPYEPAALGSAILHGPEVFNFRAAYDRFDEAGAAVPVPDAAALAGCLVEALSPDRSAELAAAAWSASSEGASVTDRVLEVLVPMLPKAQA